MGSERSTLSGFRSNREGGCMDLRLSDRERELKANARAFAERVLFPREVELELNGALPRETLDAMRQAVLDHRLNGINHAVEHGGQGHTILEQTLINEELGKATGALWAVVWHPADPLRHGTEAQKREY